MQHIYTVRIRIFNSMDSLKKLVKRLEKCIELKGNYVGKLKKIYTK